MKINRFIIYLFILCIGIEFSQAQEAVLASGGDINGQGGSVAFSLGQAAFTTHRSGGGVISQGVQQTYQIIDVTKDFDKNSTKLNCSVYPNPVVDFLVVRVENNELSEFCSIEYLLFDINGNQLLKKQHKGNQELVDMRNHVAATYFLKVTSTRTNSGFTKESTFKIVKQ